MNSEAEDFAQRAARLLSESERAQLARAGMGRRVGCGRRPALLVIDAQNYMIGAARDDDRTDYPVVCAAARLAVPVICQLLAAFREGGWPIIFTRNVAKRDGSDLGVNLWKRGLLPVEGWFLEGTRGVEISPLLDPQPSDSVISKTKQSAFHGTPVLDLLIWAHSDTVIITGGSTSNCVRATAIDSASYNFRTIVVSDAVFDRVQVSHDVNLMDIDRQLGDVMTSDAVLSYVQQLPRNEQAAQVR